MGIRSFFKKNTNTTTREKKFDGYYSQNTRIAPEMNTADFLRSYGSIGWLFAAVNRIAQDVGSSEWKSYKGDEVQQDSLALNVLKHPNRFMSQYQLLWKSAAYLELTGRCFWYIAKDGIGRPKEIWCLNPLDIWVVPDKDNFIKGYMYKAGAEQIPLDVNEVIFINLPDLLNPYSGKGPAQASANNLEIDKYTSTYIKNFFYNDARPGGIVNFPDMEETEYDRAVEQYKDKHRGVENSNEILFTKGGTVTFTPINIDLKDLDISTLKDNTRDGILGAFGVPKSIVGITDDVNRSTAEAAEYTFAMHTIKPLLHLIQDVLNNEFVPMFREDIEIKFTDPVPKNKDFIKSVVDSQVDKSITKNEARDILNKLMGWNLPHIEGGDVIYQPVSLQPIGTALPTAQPSTNTTGDSPPEEPTKMIKKKDFSKDVKKKISRQIEKNNETRHDNFLKMAEPLESEFKNIISKYLKDMQKEVVSKVLDGSKDPIDIKKWNKILQDKTISLYIKCFKTGGQAVVNEFKFIGGYIHKDLGVSFDIKDHNVQTKIQNKVSKITQINMDTNQRIKDIINEAYNNSNGEDDYSFTIRNIADKIGDEDFSQFNKSRCDTIAQTEVLTSLNQATIEGYRQNSDLIDGKAWLPSYYNSRQSHLDAGAEYGFDNPIGVNESFSVGGYDCDCPGDSSLPAGEVVNCACCMAPVVNVDGKNDSDKNSEEENSSKSIENKVDWDIINSEGYRNKFDGIGNNEDVDNKIFSSAKKMLQHRDGTELEDMYLIDAHTGKIVGMQTNSTSERRVDYNKSIKNALENSKEGSLIGIHNHPSSMPPSDGDFNSLLKNKAVKNGMAIGHNGTVYEYTKPNDYIKQREYLLSITKYKKQGYSEVTSQLKALDELKLKYQFEYKER